MDSLLLPGTCCGPDDEYENHQPRGLNDSVNIIFLCYVMYTIILYVIGKYI